MGIRRLALRLSHLGVHKTIGSSPSDETHTKAVVDGPSLCFYVYNLLKQQKLQDEPSTDRVSYHELGVAVVKWLDDLIAYGFDLYVIPVLRDFLDSRH